MKNLPVGMSENTGRNKGYRLNRTVRGKEYNFGSFQNLDHALRTNGYIDIIVADLKEAHEKEGVLSVEEIRGLIAENSLADMITISKIVDGFDSLNDHRLSLLSSEIARLHERFENDSIGKKSFWERILRR